MTRCCLLLYLFDITAFFIAATVAHEAILGASKANRPNQFPYQVSVQFQRYGHVCGGGIIDERFVLTAAHCVVNRPERLRSKSISVLAGTDSLKTPSDKAVIIPVERVFFPSDFNLSVEYSHGDIAVLKLIESLHLKHPGILRKLKLPRTYQPDLEATIAGFGWNRYEEGAGTTDGNLRFATANILLNYECERFYPQGTIQLDVHICATLQTHPIIHFVDRRSVCNGDSGGPLVYNETTVIGILSRFPSDCHERKPAIYTRIVHYVGMISNVIKYEHDPGMISLGV